MTTLDTLRRLLAADPFVPFRVALADGRLFTVQSEDDLSIITAGHPRGAWICDELIDPADIASIEPADRDARSESNHAELARRAIARPGERREPSGGAPGKGGG